MPGGSQQGEEAGGAAGRAEGEADRPADVMQLQQAGDLICLGRPESAT